MWNKTVSVGDRCVLDDLCDLVDNNCLYGD